VKADSAQAFLVQRSLFLQTIGGTYPHRAVMILSDEQGATGQNAQPNASDLWQLLSFNW